MREVEWEWCKTTHEMGCLFQNGHGEEIKPRHKPYHRPTETLIKDRSEVQCWIEKGFNKMGSIVSTFGYSYRLVKCSTAQHC